MGRQAHEFMRNCALPSRGVHPAPIWVSAASPFWRPLQASKAAPSIRGNAQTQQPHRALHQQSCYLPTISPAFILPEPHIPAILKVHNGTLVSSVLLHELSSLPGAHVARSPPGDGLLSHFGDLLMSPRP